MLNQLGMQQQQKKGEKESEKAKENNAGLTTLSTIISISILNSINKSLVHLWIYPVVYISIERNLS